MINKPSINFTPFCAHSISAKILFMFFLIPINLSSYAHYPEDNKIIICSESGQIPYEMLTKQGEWVGFDVDMIREFSKYLNINFEFKDTKWDGIILALQTGHCDIIASISVPQGTTPDFITKKSIKYAKIIKYETNSDAISALLTNKVDIFIGDKSYILMTSLILKNKFHIFQDDLFTENIALAFRKKDIKLREEFNKFLKKWKESGNFQKIYNYYFNSLDWKNELK